VKIENEKTLNVVESLVKSKTVKPSGGTNIRGNTGSELSDRVELTSRQAEMDRIREKVREAPAVRQEKVGPIKEALKAETYNVRGELVARSLLKDHLLDEIL
jgi:flagellar biosynthesis anti-sigma factor FlgM